jgi:lipid-A-disaccharide synthase
MHASKAVVCSGTATLEAAIIGTPTLLVYIAKPIDYFIATKFVTTLRHVGLANIVADFDGADEIHPELLQDAVTTEAILSELERTDEAEFLKKSFWLRGRLEGKEKALTQFFV